MFTITVTNHNGEKTEYTDRNEEYAKRRYLSLIVGLPAVYSNETAIKSVVMTDEKGIVSQFKRIYMEPSFTGIG